jgi:hypothetical protein
MKRQFEVQPAAMSQLEKLDAQLAAAHGVDLKPA